MMAVLAVPVTRLDCRELMSLTLHVEADVCQLRLEISFQSVLIPGLEPGRRFPSTATSTLRVCHFTRRA